MNNTFETIEQYNEARMMHDTNHEAVMQYCKEHKTNGIPSKVAETFPFADKVDNELRAKIEVWEFLNDIPETYFLYINEAKWEATNWTGVKLGKVSFGKEYSDNFGGRRVPVSVYAINGKTYHGTYYKSAGNYARIKLYKNQSNKKMREAL